MKVRKVLIFKRLCITQLLLLVLGLSVSMLLKSFFRYVTIQLKEFSIECHNSKQLSPSYNQSAVT